MFDYTVASGDNETGIAGRFGVCVGDLRSSVRDLSVYVGEHISVSRTTTVPLGTGECAQPG